LVAFNQDIQRKFATIQTHLTDEPTLGGVTPGGGCCAAAGARSSCDGAASGLPS